ncbi:MAG TPA: hypothetical protein VI316_10800 [Candidatus Dormibacteraeota bacterium]
MSAAGPDTVLDGLAAEVRTHPPLDLRQVGELLAAARSDPHGAAAATLVEHHLFLCLEAALARGSAPLEVTDVFQEASVALVAAVAAYAVSGGPAAGLQDYSRREIASHLDAALAQAQRLREADEALLRDSRLLEAVEVELRHRLGRDPSAAEVAATLSWDEQRVTLMATLVAEARARNDLTLLPFLDDLEESTEPEPGEDPS